MQHHRHFKYDLEKIKRDTDIVEVISHYVPLQKRGPDYVGLCPVHAEKTPSFAVTRSKGMAFCYGCGAHYDVISFIMEMEHIDLPAACERLTGNISFLPKLSTPAAPPKPERITSKPPPDAPTPSMLLQHLGEPIQIYPLRDLDGSLICYEARYDDPNDKSRMWTWGGAEGQKPRWACRHPNSPRPLYGLDRLRALPDDAPVLITEGPKKAEAGHRLLGSEYVSISWTGGANAMRDHDYSHLAGRTCLLWPDADKQQCNSMRAAAAFGCAVGDIMPYEHQPGPKAMFYLGEILHGLGCKVRLVNVQGTMPSGWDIADAEADRWSREDIMTWLEDRVRDFTPGKPQVDEDGRVFIPNPRMKEGRVLSLSQNHYGPASPPGSQEELLASIMSVLASDVKMEPVRWLWPGRIARGKISLLVGDPGLGKSQVCASIAAVVTTGGRWPADRTECEKGSVILMSAEDDAKDTIAPRLEAAGADRSKVRIVNAIHFHNREDDTLAQRAFSVTDDLAKLGALLDLMRDVRLLIIDPISAYMGSADSYKNSEVRGMLTPLMNMAQDRRLAVLLISHLTKAQGSSALMRVQGSIALPALARAVWGITKDAEEPERRLFMAMKNNLGKDNTGLAYTIESAVVESEDGPIDTSLVMWEGDAVTMGSEEAFSDGGNNEEREEKREARAFLRSLLANGPVFSSTVKKDATDVGYNMTMLHRLKKSLGIEVKKVGTVWCWAMKGQVRVPNDYRDREN